MGRNNEAEGEPPSPELPPDRIHYLLPKGCSEITDKWAREEEQKRVPSKVTEKITEKAFMALSLFEEEALKQLPPPVKPPAVPLTSKVVLPECISVQDLARKLDMKVFAIIKAAICMKAFLKAESILPFSTASQICEILGVEALRSDPPEEAAGT